MNEHARWPIEQSLLLRRHRTVRVGRRWPAKQVEHFRSALQNDRHAGEEERAQMKRQDGLAGVGDVARLLHGNPLELWDDEPQRIVGSGPLRGTILHKLMEELITGELGSHSDEAIERAAELLAELQPTASDEPDAGNPDAIEMAETALRTFALPELAPFLTLLVAEIPLWAANPPHFLAGRADAAAIDGKRISLVIDWKSDVTPDAAAHSAHAAQLRDYLRVTGAERGAVVYMSRGQVSWVEPA